MAARRRVPLLGRLIARLADRVERTVARRSAAVVAISPTFLEKLTAWGVADKSIVVPNWAPIEELPLREADNEWRARAGLSGHPVVLYSGTLGLKHDPAILAVSRNACGRRILEARVVVISEGQGRDWLEAWKRGAAARAPTTSCCSTSSPTRTSRRSWRVRTCSWRCSNPMRPGSRCRPRSSRTCVRAGPSWACCRPTIGGRSAHRPGCRAGVGETRSRRKWPSCSTRTSAGGHGLGGTTLRRADFQPRDGGRPL